METQLHSINSNVPKLDNELAMLIEKELQRHRETIQLIAAENITRWNVLTPLSSILVSKTAEGSPGSRYHSGCSVIDDLEILAEQRGRELYHARQCWLQPLSGSLANLVVIMSLFRGQLRNPSEVRILSMALDQGGHLSHGSQAHITGMLFPNLQQYTLNRDTNLLDYDAIEEHAMAYKPNLLICGASAYPRQIDFRRFGEIANKCGAIMLADIAHISGLITAELHQTPIPHSHFVTCSTYKAGGPKGGVILAGDMATDVQRKNIDRMIFPGIQSTPDFSSIAAKAAFFKECMTDEYRKTQQSIIRNARTLAASLIERKLEIVTGGTDNHIVLVNTKKSVGLTGKEADKRLEFCGINANKNVLPFDDESPMVGSGIRIGTNTVSRLGMGTEEMRTIAGFIAEILKTEMSPTFVSDMKLRVKNLMRNFPIDSFISSGQQLEH